MPSSHAELLDDRAHVLLGNVDLHLLPGSQSVALVKPLLDQGGRLLGEDGMVQMSKYAAESSVYEKEYARLIAKQ